MCRGNRTIRPPDNSPLGQLAPGQLAPGQLAPGQLVPGQLAPGQLAPRTTRPPGQQPYWCAYRRVFLGASCPRGELTGGELSWGGRVVLGASCPGASCPRGELSGGRIVLEPCAGPILIDYPRMNIAWQNMNHTFSCLCMRILASSNFRWGSGSTD